MRFIDFGGKLQSYLGYFRVQINVWKPHGWACALMSLEWSALICQSGGLPAQPSGAMGVSRPMAWVQLFTYLQLAPISYLAVDLLHGKASQAGKLS
jgi:hypothetical protein